jgi:hypothetical protein
VYPSILEETLFIFGQKGYANLEGSLGHNRYLGVEDKTFKSGK